jgi:hypothetical protein
MLSTDGSAAAETAEMPDTSAKKIATNLAESRSPKTPNIVILLFLYRARLSLFPEALLAGSRIERRIDGLHLGAGAVCQNDQGAG